MKITVEISDSELRQVRQITGERKKGPAIRKLVADALLLKRRADLAQKFISGKCGVELEGYESARAAEKRKTKIADMRWRAENG